MNDLSVNEIWIYPIKSTRGLLLDESGVEHSGLHNDRRWMLIDANDKFITQRECGALSQVVAQAQGNAWRVCAPGMTDLLMQTPGTNAQPILGQVWSNQKVPVVLADDATNLWFSHYLAQPVRAVYQADNHSRLINEPQAQANDTVSLADGYPLLLIGTASLADLNTRLKVPVDMRQFRPNIVVNTLQPFIEDSWKKIRIGAVEFDVAKNCSRCVLTTRNPDSGELNTEREPLRTLSQYRRQEGGVMFGQNLIPRGLKPNSNRIYRGDNIEILA